MTSTIREFINADEVADMIGVSRATFMRHRLDLEAREDFPRPMPHTRSPLLWRRSQVTAWIEAQGRYVTRDVAHVDVGPNVVLMREARRA